MAFCFFKHPPHTLHLLTINGSTWSFWIAMCMAFNFLRQAAEVSWRRGGPEEGGGGVGNCGGLFFVLPWGVRFLFCVCSDIPIFFSTVPTTRFIFLAGPLSKGNILETSFSPPMPQFVLLIPAGPALFEPRDSHPRSFFSSLGAARPATPLPD